MNHDMKDFNNDIIEQSKKIPVLVDFWAEWCGPCKVLGPVLEKLADKHKDKWVLVKLNTDKNPDLAAKYGIRGIPNVKLFVNGEVVNEFTGALPEHMIEDWLKKAIPGKSSKRIEEAKRLIEENKDEESIKILEDVHQQEPDNEDAKILLAKLLVFSDLNKAVQLSKNVDSKPENYELAESIQTIASLFEKSNNGIVLSESSVRENYLSAIEDLKQQKFDSSLEKFIDVIRNDRDFDNDGARKACIAIFKYLGEENEITLKNRRDFGSALYI